MRTIDPRNQWTYERRNGRTFMWCDIGECSHRVVHKYTRGAEKAMAMHQAEAHHGQRKLPVYEYTDEPQF